jgi:hypothetical protein
VDDGEKSEIGWKIRVKSGFLNGITLGEYSNNGGDNFSAGHIPLNFPHRITFLFYTYPPGYPHHFNMRRI